MSNTVVISALLMGLFGGGHCVAMCGGVSSVICAGAGAAKGRFALAYNAGRVASYTALGLIVGFASSLSLGLPLDIVRFSLRTLAAVCMLTVGLHLAGLPSFVRTLESVGAPIWRRIAPLAKRLLPLRSAWHALGAGMLWAFMPCGLLYGALAMAASAETPAQGALTMAAFGLGTLPIMLGVGLVAGQVAKAMSHLWVRRLAGMVVLGFGLWSTAGLAGQVGLGRHEPHACCPHK